MVLQDNVYVNKVIKKEILGIKCVQKMLLALINVCNVVLENVQNVLDLKILRMGKLVSV